MSTTGEEHYPQDSILFLEEMWGDGFLSPGGPEEVRRLLSGLDVAGKHQHPEIAARAISMKARARFTASSACESVNTSAGIPPGSPFG